MSIETVNNADKSRILRTQPRTTVQLTFPDEVVLEGPKGETLEAYMREYYHQNFTALAALVNGSLRELMTTPHADAHVTPLTYASSEGMRIYRRSLTFLLVTAVEELYPEADLMIDYTVPYGGYFCRLLTRPELTEDELVEIESHMRAIVEEDAPIRRDIIDIEEAKEIFRARGECDTLNLLHRRSKGKVSVYHLRNRRDIFYGYMVPSAGYLQGFSVIPAENGFVLQYPSGPDPFTMDTPYETPQLSEVFREYGNWLRVLGSHNVAQINDIIARGAISETILVSEALHERRIASIAKQIVAREKVKVVLIAGPSSSGKTTFSKRLAIQLMTHGIRPHTLEMDRYFVERAHTPRNEDGTYDFESIGAMDTRLLQTNLQDLIAGKAVQIPTFDFNEGKRLAGPTVHLDSDQIIIAEGIHGLNPQLLPLLDHAIVFRIYISALTQLNIDRHNRVLTSDVRLLRRIVRDARHRGWRADDTLGMWESVQRGEQRNIFPYQENADAMFNSALVYETAVIKPYVTPLLLQVHRESPNCVAARRLLAFLRLCDEAPAELVPDNSLLREFIGGSILRDYLPGKIAAAAPCDA